jgi:UDP-N-acetylmuramoyl-L-alanyl-D-glutamate--2,6-diaminopimelate ligase
METAETGVPMRLAELTEALEDKMTYGPSDAEIVSIESDSRQIDPGGLFVALRGSATDGHHFVRDAVARGAAAVVTENPVEDAGVPNVVVSDTSKALAILSARFFGNPADRLFLCGITGTDGKTSTAHMYQAIVDSSGRGRVGIVGTLGHGARGELQKTAHTTPAPVELHKQLRRMVDNGCIGVAVEVSSHAVRQHRAWGLDFDVGILTNVTRDHLDFHITIEDYRAAKREFCESLVASHRTKPAGTLVYSDDDPTASEIGRAFPGKKMSVRVKTNGASNGSRGSSNVSAENVVTTLEGTSFELHIDDGRETRTVHIDMKLLGSFCAANAALAAAAARVTGVSVEDIKRGLESIERIPGRFEKIGGAGKPVVVIDYSHTPNSMERVLRTCRSLNPDRLVTVFGCGGERDRSKRPEMGRIAQSQSDFVYVTMDNPRTEPIETIVRDILSGMDTDANDYRVDLNRSRAIFDAIGSAGSGDLIVLLGKGVEDHQIVGTDRLPFSDRKEADGALRSWRNR